MPKTPKPIPAPPLTEAMYDRGVKSTKRRSFDVVAVGYRRDDDTIALDLRGGVCVAIPRMHVREFATAKPSDLRHLEVQPGGAGILLRKLDIDIYVPGLLSDEIGGIFAAAMGRKTRGTSTKKKAAAARVNGQKGGRPKKKAV